MFIKQKNIRVNEKRNYYHKNKWIKEKNYTKIIVYKQGFQLIWYKKDSLWNILFSCYSYLEIYLYKYKYIYTYTNIHAHTYRYRHKCPKTSNYKHKRIYTHT